MAGSINWIRNHVRGKACSTCGTCFTEYAVRELRFRLTPRPKDPGYGALLPVAVTVCPTCRQEQQWDLSGGDQASMKLAIAWMARRTRLIINPLTGNLLVPSEIMDGNPSPGSEEGEAPEKKDEEDAAEPDEQAATPPPEKPSAAASNRRPGRRLTVPSIRACCPPDPITDELVAIARRKLRIYSDCRFAPSFPRFMRRFGVGLDEPYV